MDTFVAFLRGMNLGRRRVKNHELRECLESLGFEGVEPFLASGNVIFRAPRADSDALEAAIGAGLEERFAYPVPTYLRTAAEVQAIGGRQPFTREAMDASTGNVQVGLLAGTPTASEREAVLALQTDDDRLSIEGREFYWLPRGNMSDSELDPSRFEAVLGRMTVRTQRTLIRLAAKLP
jgi:uncharacterized protein (DUF1697 family)